MKIDLNTVRNLIEDTKGIELLDSEVEVAKEILNTLNKELLKISSPQKVLNFCYEALKYNPVNEFI